MPGATKLDELTERARRIVARQLPAGGAPGAAALRLPFDAAAQQHLVLGIDPGTATTGFGLVRATQARSAAEPQLAAVAFGVLQTAAGLPMPARLLELYRGMCSLIEQHRPHQAAVEQLFFGRNITTAVTVGQARGVILLALAQAGVPVAEYTPMEVKHASAGSGRAGKAQMQRTVQTLLGLEAPPRPDDAADALALALCHVRLARMRALGLR